MKEEKPIAKNGRSDSIRQSAVLIWHWIKRTVFAILLLFLFLNLLLQIPAVQNWAAREVTTALEKRLETEVRIDYLYLAFFDKLVIQGLYVKDYYVDTLLYSKELTVNINTNPVVLYRRGLEIEEIGLSGARVNLRRRKGDPKTNFQMMAERLFPSDPGKEDQERKTFRMNIRKIDLDDVQFLQDDEVKGKRLSIYLSRGVAWLDAFNIAEKHIEANELRLHRPRIELQDLPENPFAGQEPVGAVETAQLSEDTTGFFIVIEDFSLSDGQFILDNYRKAPVKETEDDKLDFRHLNVQEINIEIDSFFYAAETYRGQVKELSLKERSGFVINHIKVEDASVSPQKVQLNSLEILTPNSQVSDTLVFKYSTYWDFTEFDEKVTMDGRLNNSLLALKDIMAFAPALKNNIFFRNNRERVLKLDGRIRGKINNLRGSNLNILLLDEGLSESTLRLAGSFSSRNLGLRNEEFVNLRLEQLKTNMRTLRQLIPNFNPPSNFDKLGSLNFRGSFDGFFVDFVAYGDLRTDIGRAEMDMRMNLKGGRDRASYSGKLSLSQFDLGRWSGNQDFGIVNFTSEVKNGVGLSGDKASAKLNANIESFGFKGYNYENATLEGQLNKYLFNGFFAIQDENIDFSFRGELDYTDSIPTYDFDASVNKLDLKKLNLSKDNLILAGNIDLELQNDKLADMEGRARINDFVIIHNLEQEYRVDSIFASSTFNALGIKTFTVDSDLLKGNIQGAFDIEQIPNAFLRYASRNYPEFSQRFGLKDSLKQVKPHQFTYDIYVRDSKGLNELIDRKLGQMRNIRLHGYFDDQRDSLLIDIDAPQFQYDKVRLVDLVLIAEATRDQGELDLGVDSTILNDKTVLSTITLLSIFEKDTLLFGLNYLASDPTSLLDNLNLNGRLFLADSTNFKIQFDQSNLVILENPWIINENNFITFGKGFIDTRDFILRNNERKIVLERIKETGLKLSLTNFDFSLIDEYWDYDPLDFEGRFNVNAEIGDIFSLTDIFATVTADTFLVNDDDWGAFRLDASSKNIKAPFNAYLSITRDTSQLLAEGYYNPPNLDPEYVTMRGFSKQTNYFDLTLDISGYPLNISEYWIGESVSNTIGSFNANLRLFGQPAKPEVNGFILARRGAVTIDFLQTRYTFDQSFISVNNTLFDATGTVLYDKYRHTALVYGGVSHHHLKDLGFNARLRTQNFLALDTKKEDNDLFYGHALGNGEISFTGSFKQPDIYINARVGDSTRIVIPITSDAEGSELSFIRFVEKYKTTEEQNFNKNGQEDPGGVSLEMDLIVTEEAEMELVFDEQAGDIVKGNGRGNIRMIVPRTGDFQMFGDYVIEEGNYLFTLYNVVNKDFRVKKGGLVQWTGDPYAAQIQLEAEYKDLKTPLLPFIAEYLETADPGVKNQAAQASDVDLTLKLSGELMEPNINFDIAFPSLSGQLQTYTDSKIRILKQDQNEMNRQVFGLIVVGQFLPSDLSFQGSDLIYNTVSEFVSNQLSLLITELFSEIIADGKVLSGIDFDIAYNQYQSMRLGDGQDISGGEEFQVRLKQNFFDNRLSILVGGNVDFGNNLQARPESSGAFVGNDVVIEYVLNKDRSLKLRVYQRLRPDIGGGSRFEVGTGLSFRREFNSFGEFIRNLRRDARKQKEKKGN